MSLKKSVVIIGAGIGGIATSVYLSRKGYDVSVYEKKFFSGRPVWPADS
jgi:phytoene dehydrogenase-like protein